MVLRTIAILWRFIVHEKLIFGSDFELIFWTLFVILYIHICCRINMIFYGNAHILKICLSMFDISLNLYLLNYWFRVILVFCNKHNPYRCIFQSILIVCVSLLWEMFFFLLSFECDVFMNWVCFPYWCCGGNT